MSSASKKKESIGPVGFPNSAKLSCHYCGRTGKARDKKFPVRVYRKVRKFDKDQDGKLRVITEAEPLLVGYVCRKCVRKEVKRGRTVKREQAVTTIQNYR